MKADGLGWSSPTSPDSATQPEQGRQLSVMWRFPGNPYPKAVEKDAVSFVATVLNGEQQDGEGVAGQGREGRTGYWLSFVMRCREVLQSGPCAVVPA